MTGVLARLLEVASEQHGLFTVEQAHGVGVGAEQVRRLAANETVERRCQGVYRIATVPFNQYSEPMEAVLWANRRALIGGASALVLWDLADVNPRKIHLVVPAGYRPRRAGGALYQVHSVRFIDADRDEVNGVPVVTPEIAIAQSIDWGVAGDMVEQAIGRATARELIGTSTAQRLRGVLDKRSATEPKVTAR